MPMKKFLHSHPSLILGTLTLIFFVVLIAFYFWAINDTFIQLRSALIAPPPQSEKSFDLVGAAALGLPGMVKPAPSPAPAATSSAY
jgi:hypothetical protein